MAENYMKTEPISPHGHHVSSRSSSAQNSDKDSSDSDSEILKSNNSISYKERRREAHTQVRLCTSMRCFNHEIIF